MKYLKYFYPICIMTLIMSCGEASDSEDINAVIDIYVQNVSGDNLLNEVYFENEMSLFYVNNNVIEQVNDPSMGTPQNFKFITIENETVLRVFPNYNNEEHPTTLLKWNDEDVDTIKCHYNSSANSSISLDTVWYNDERMLPDHFFGPTEGFKIVK